MKSLYLIVWQFMLCFVGAICSFLFFFPNRTFSMISCLLDVCVWECDFSICMCFLSFSFDVFLLFGCFFPPTMACFFWFLCTFILFNHYFRNLFVFQWEKGRRGVYLNGKRNGEDMRGVEGGKTITWIYCMETKSIFNKNLEWTPLSKDRHHHGSAYVIILAMTSLGMELLWLPYVICILIFSWLSSQVILKILRQLLQSI